MREQLHPGPHPDADSLNAFLEGALPEHERLQCLAHLAECGRCREVVYLAEEPPRVPIRRRWFAPIPVLSAAAAACVLVVAVWIYLHRAPVVPPAPEVAKQPAVVSPPVTLRAKPEPHRSARREAQPPPQVALSGITGTVTDPSGATISGATVTLHELGGTSTGNAQTDASGKFKVAGLPPGRYQLQISAAGFQLSSIQIDLPPQEVAVVTPTLSIGTSTETVEVVAATPTLQTESTPLAVAPHPLPSKMPVSTTITSGKVMLALDSAGGLFLSTNQGKSWKAVKPVWQGKIVELAEPAPPSTAAFQLTTDSGSAWLSRDGSHWYPAP